MPDVRALKEKIFWRRCDEVLHYIWDPIGVSDEPGARDEYEGYVPQVVKLLMSGAEEEAVVEHLVRIEVRNMGLGSTRENAARAADALVRWRDWVHDPEPPR